MVRRRFKDGLAHLCPRFSDHSDADADSLAVRALRLPDARRPKAR